LVQFAAAFCCWVAAVLAQTNTSLPVRGKALEDGSFIPGTTGREWTPPDQMDLTRVNNAQRNKEITDWATTSWSEVNCCKKLNKDSIWDDRTTGVPDCFCRDLLTETEYKTAGFCALQQSCENALKDWNKVFGEGYMVPGKAPEWSTESPARTCMREVKGKWKALPCGDEQPESRSGPTSWTDPYGRVPPVEGFLPTQEYGTVIVGEDPNSKTAWRWIPGDVPQAKKKWQGFRAADNKIQAGLMAGSRVYPGENHTQCCTENATSSCCRSSPHFNWRSAVDAYQADCMFAVKRAICAYHFWECDASYHDRIFNGVCQHACDDIPKLCGTIPSTGEQLELHQFTLGGFYHLGCTVKKREYIKDCTAGGSRTSYGLSATLTAVVALALATVSLSSSM